MLFKIKRDCEKNDLAKVLFFDCKSPSVRKLSAEDLLRKISKSIRDLVGSRIAATENAYVEFENTISSIGNKSKFCIIFDEIEYISHLSQTDAHWKSDFVDFWQAIWSAQSVMRNFSFIICGVNPYVVEIPEINGVQNPIFGIVSPRYIKGLSGEDNSRMIRYVGKRMGLSFDSASIKYLNQEFNGHPLLTRVVCSKVHQYISFENYNRPVTIDGLILKNVIESTQSEIDSYCTHIISELKRFYPDEYDALEMLATGLLSDFMDIASDSHFIGHLSSYGILSINKDRKPEIQFPTLRRYLKSQASREKGRVAGRYLVDKDKRAFWIDSIRKRIIEDFRILSDNLEKSQRNMIYITNGIPDADMFLATDVVNSENSFRSFISTCNQVFVENIVNRSGPAHYKTQFSTAHPYLKESFDRVKCYRHWQNHNKLDDGEIKDNYNKFIEKDIGGKTNLLDGEDWFVLQQITLDEIHSALQWEIASLAS